MSGSLRRPVAAGMLVAALALPVIGGCGADDRALKPPSPDQTTTTRPPTSAAGASEAIESTQFTLSSGAFAQNGGLPDRYTCKGMGIAPPLAWRNVPSGTEELAVVMRADNQQRTLHWVMAGINPRAGQLLEGQVPQTAAPFPNQVNGQPGWAAPCPTAPGTYRYDFTVYALSSATNIPALSTGPQAAQLIDAAPRTGIALITGTVTVQ